MTWNSQTEIEVHVSKINGRQYHNYLPMNQLGNTVNNNSLRRPTSAREVDLTFSTTVHFGSDSTSAHASANWSCAVVKLFLFGPHLTSEKDMSIITVVMNIHSNIRYADDTALQHNVCFPSDVIFLQYYRSLYMAKMYLWCCF